MPKHGKAIASYLQNNSSTVFGIVLAATFFVVGFYVPVPISNLVQLGSSDLAALIETLPVFGNGFTPWVFAILIVETILIAFRGLKNSELAKKGYVDPFCRPVIALAVAVSFATSIDLVQDLLSVYAPESDATFSDIFSAAISLTAGTAVIVLLGRWIESRIPEFGLWLLLGIAGLSDVHLNLENLTEAFFVGAVSGNQVMVIAAVTLAQLAACCWLLQVRRKAGGPGEAAYFLPWLFAMWLPSYANALLPASWTATTAWQMFWNEYGTAVVAVEQAVVLLLVTGIYFIRHRRWHLLVCTLTGCLVILLLSVLLEANNRGQSILSGFHMVIVAAAASRMLAGFRNVRPT